MKREDELVKRSWRVSDIFAGTVALTLSGCFRGLMLVVELEGERTW